MNDDSNYTIEFIARAIVSILIFVIASLCFAVGYESGKSAGQKDTAIIMIQTLNQINKKLPEEQKISNPFTDEQLRPLSKDAQIILKLF